MAIDTGLIRRGMVIPLIYLPTFANARETNRKMT